MYFTDRGIEELETRRGDEEISLSWLADQLRAFVDENPEFEVAVERLASAAEPLPAGVHPVPAAVEERVARHKLAALGVRCDDLTATQEDYLRGWRLGT